MGYQEDQDWESVCSPEFAIDFPGSRSGEVPDTYHGDTLRFLAHYGVPELDHVSRDGWADLREHLAECDLHGSAPVVHSSVVVEHPGVLQTFRCTRVTKGFVECRCGRVAFQRLLLPDMTQSDLVARVCAFAARRESSR